jgi:hypothetical protein
MGLGIALAWLALERHEAEIHFDTLQNLRELLGLYIHSHSETWPNSMVELLKDEDASEALGADYTYIDWQKLASGPKWGFGEFPVLYESHLSDHDGAGVYVLLTDGLIIWDPDAAWLRNFSQEHPAYKITAPQ